MKITSVLKTIMITGVIAILTSIPTFAQYHTPNTVDATVIYSDSQIIQATYNNKTYIIEHDADTSNEQWNKGETIILDLNAEDAHEALNGLYNGIIVQTYPDKNNLVVVNVEGNLYSFYADDNNYKVNDKVQLTFKNDEVIKSNLINIDSEVIDHYTNETSDIVTVYKNGEKYTNLDVQIQSINYIDKSITVDKHGDLYKFYVDDPDKYYLSEQVNITMDSNNQIIDCTVDSEPQVYNTEISQKQGEETFLIVNGNKYMYEDIEGTDGWQVGEKCKVIIQDGRLLEIRPIPLNER